MYGLTIELGESRCHWTRTGRRTITDAAPVDLAHRCEPAEGSGYESFVGRVNLGQGEVVFTTGEPSRAGNFEYDIAGDAEQV